MSFLELIKRHYRSVLWAGLAIVLTILTNTFDYMKEVLPHKETVFQGENCTLKYHYKKHTRFAGFLPMGFDKEGFVLVLNDSPKEYFKLDSLTIKELEAANPGNGKFIVPEITWKDYLSEIHFMVYLVGGMFALLGIAVVYRRFYPKKEGVIIDTKL